MTGKQLGSLHFASLPLSVSHTIPVSWSRNENRLEIWLEACCDISPKVAALTLTIGGWGKTLFPLCL